LLRAAERNLIDARVPAISADTQFDAAYKAIMQCSMAALAAAGFRTSRSQPGHHQTAIHCLGMTLGTDTATIILLDALRKKRNLSDYSGDPVSGAVVSTCIEAATSLLVETTRWISLRYPPCTGGGV